jgi:hypothetical protein
VCQCLLFLFFFDKEPSSEQWASVASRGVNGNFIPINPWQIPLLELGYMKILIYIGIDLGLNSSPIGYVGMGTGKQNPNSITRG